MITLALVLTTFLALYLAVLTNALGQYSPSALRNHLGNGRGKAAAWLTARIDAAHLLVSLGRTTARMAIFALLVVKMIGFGEQITITAGRLVATAAVATLIVWLVTSIIARSIAKQMDLHVLAVSLPLIRISSLVFVPFIGAVRWTDELVRRLGGIGEKSGDAQAEADLLHRIEDTQMQGGLDQDAAEMLENLVQFGSTDVGEVMTPRTDIEGIQLTDDLDAIREFIDQAGHSRIPVYGEDLDDIRGILYVKDLIPYLGRDASDFTLQPLLRKTLNVPDSKAVSEMLAEFQHSEVHMAIVVDEYGGTQGLVTIEDVLEEIVGEIQDEHDPEDEVPPTLNRIDDRTAEVDARFHIDDLNEQLALDIPEDEEFDTVGGFLLSRFGHVPKVGETFDAYNARFEAVEATPTRVQRVSIHLLDADASSNGQADENE